MKRFLVKLLLVSLLITSAAGMSGCQGIRNYINSRNGGSSDADSSQGYNIYYINNSETMIGAFPYKLSATKGTAIIDECIDALRAKPDDKGYKAVLNDEVNIVKDGYPGNDRTLKLYFDENYSKMSKTTEILVRAAIVKTLTQFSGIVNYVSFCVGDKWIQDDSGNTLKMNGEDYVSTLNLLKTQVTEADFSLYFASKDGKNLKKTTVSMKYDQTTHPEQVVIDALIRGPSENDLKAVLSKSTQIRSTYVKDGVCQVDFNQGFLEKVGSQSFYLNLYSVVNSLAELDDIDKVQITVDGKNVETGPDNVPMGGELSPDMSLVSE